MKFKPTAHRCSPCLQAAAVALLFLVTVPSAQALIQIELESFELETYAIESNEFASGGALVSLLGADGTSGLASTRFRGAAGTYAVVVTYVDEADGAGQLALQVNGSTVESWTLDDERGDNFPVPATFTARTISGVSLNRGDTIAIAGSRGTGEQARVDFVQIIEEAIVLEAEDATFSPDFVARHRHEGFTGAGYVDVEGEGSLEWLIDSERGGDYALKVRYALATDSLGVRPLDVHVNDERKVAGLRFPVTGRANHWQTADAIVALVPGLNRIRLQTTGTSGANLDHLSAAPLQFLTEGGPLAPAEDAAAPDCTPGVDADPGYYDSYYGRVDPGCERATLADFRAVNGFDDSLLVDNAQYINAADLGFGRDMYCLDNGRAACYVDNYLDPKGASQLIATVAMERMTYSGRTVVAFFVYDRDGNRVNEIPDGHRLNQLPLDSEGPKSVPESCYACHFGYTTAGNAPAGGQYLPFDVDSFEDWPGHPTRAEQMDAFRRLNRLVWSDASVGDRKLSLKTLVEGWYDGPPFTGTAYDADRLPADGWYTDPLGYQDIDDRERLDRYFRERFLYKTVYARFCRGCHVTQGPAEDVNAHYDGLDWTSGAMFENQAFYQICDLRSSLTMPHAEVTYDKFYNDEISSTDGEVASARDRLCGQQPPDYVTRVGADAGDGETLFGSVCASCHTVEGSGYPDPDLTCKGSRVYGELGRIDSAMNSLTLNRQQVADMRAYLDSFEQCPPAAPVLTIVPGFIAPAP